MAIIKVRGDFFAPENSTALRDFGFHQSAGRTKQAQAPAEESYSSIAVPYGMENYAQDAGTYVGRQAFAKGGHAKPAGFKTIVEKKPGDTSRMYAKGGPVKHDDEKQDRALIKSMIAKEEKGERTKKAKGGRAKFEDGGDAGGSDASGGNDGSGEGAGAEGSASVPADMAVLLGPGPMPATAARSGPPPVAPPAMTHTPGDRSGFQTVASWPEWDARAAIITPGDPAPVASPQASAAVNPQVAAAANGSIYGVQPGSAWNVDGPALRSLQSLMSGNPPEYAGARTEAEIQAINDSLMRRAKGGRALIPRSMKARPLQAHSPIGTGGSGPMRTLSPRSSAAAPDVPAPDPMGQGIMSTDDDQKPFMALKRGGSVNAAPRNPVKTRTTKNIMPGGELAYGVQPSTEPGGLKKGGKVRRA